MAPKKTAAKAAPTAVPSGHPRNWTPEQRRAAFNAARKEQTANYQILEADFKETLIPYDHIVLDSVLGLKGIARHGSVTQFHGDEGAGKTSSAVCSAAAYQKTTGEPIAYFDYEGSSSPEFLKRCGVDTDMLFFMQPASIQDAIKEHVRLMDEVGVRLFVNDSIPFMDTKIEKKLIYNGKAFKGNYGSHAKTISTFYKMLRPYTQEFDASLLMINQTRDRIDDSTEAGWASEHSYTNRIYTLPGGRMARFAPSVMMELTLKKALAPKAIADMETDEIFILDVCEPGQKLDPTMNLVRCRTLKNKPTGAGFRKADIYIRPGRGWDETVSILALGRSLKLITNSGAKWSIGKAGEAFATYPNKADAIENLVIKRDMEVLGKLKSLVTASLAGNEAMFAAEVSSEELDFLDESKTTSFNIEGDEDELG
jgi:RecA/RadA recombinase